MTFDYATNESYSLSITSSTDEVSALISADNFFGARHGLETLSQLIVYDDLKNSLVMLNDVNIEDGPRFIHRGRFIRNLSIRH
jgi:hexosaminidase